MIAFLILAIFALVIASLRWPFWKKNKEGLVVLCYHKIGTPPAGPFLRDLWVSPEKFRAQVKYLIDNGYKTLSFSDLLKIYEDKSELPKKSVLITFDDGYENNYKIAYPILKELGAKGNIFLVYNTIGKVNVWHKPQSEAWINMATLEQLKEMVAGGVIEFGGHTMNHPHLSQIEHEAAVSEINESKKAIENALGIKMCAFAYPYGDGAYNKDVRKAALDAGYTFDFSFKEGITPWPWKRDEEPLDRLFIKGDDTLFDLKIHITKGIARII